MQSHLKGLLVTGAGVLMVVPESLLVRLIAADAITIAFFKALLAGSVVGLAVLATSGRAGFARFLGLGPRAWLYTAAAGAAGVLFVLAVANTSVANVVFIVAGTPVFAALASRAALGERLSRRTSITIALVGAGIATIALGSGESAVAHPFGDLLALCAAIAFATALTAARSLRPVSPAPGIALGYLAAALLLAPFAHPASVPQSSWLYVALHGGVFMAASTMLISLGTRYLPAPEVALLILGESVLAPLLVWAVLGEVPGAWTLMGGTLVLGTLALSNALALARLR